MGKKRKKYTDDFKVDAVRQVVEGDRPVREVAESLGVSENLLFAWKRKLLAGGRVLPKKGERSMLDLERENRELKKKLAQAEQDREILKKAAAYFASHGS
ncbi:MAG: transposase [Planctomycetota bacterium]